MSREVKFRAWSKSENMMGEVTGLRFSKSQYPFVNVRIRKNGKTVDEGYHFGQEDGCDSVILMQFTGLYDKNGVEIYEGDVVQRRVSIYKLGEKAPIGEYLARGKVVWNKSSFTEGGYYTVSTYDHLGNTIKNTLFSGTNGWYVIGNIYENPELLKE